MKIAGIEVKVDKSELKLKNVVYLLTFPNNKKYVGITTKSLKERLIGHCNNLTADTKKIRAIKKYTQFTCEVLYEAENLEELNTKEVEFIQEYNSLEYGYNSTLGGDGTLGAFRSDESKELSRESNWNKKYIICKNIYTGEEIDFKSMNQADNYFEVIKGTVASFLCTDRLFQDVFIFRFIEEEYDSYYDQFEGSEYINQELYLEGCIIRGYLNECIRY